MIPRTRSSSTCCKMTVAIKENLKRLSTSAKWDTLEIETNNPHPFFACPYSGHYLRNAARGRDLVRWYGLENGTSYKTEGLLPAAKQCRRVSTGTNQKLNKIRVNCFRILKSKKQTKIRNCESHTFLWKSPFQRHSRGSHFKRLILVKNRLHLLILFFDRSIISVSENHARMISHSYSPSSSRTKIDLSTYNDCSIDIVSLRNLSPAIILTWCPPEVLSYWRDALEQESIIQTELF